MRGIGQMARECALSVSALRFYDGAGVLVPARVDPASGYRSYSDEQVTSARLIARLRRVGMPIAEICLVLEHQRNRSTVQQILQTHLTRLEDGLADARRELSAALSLLDNHQERPMTITTVTTVTTVTMTREALSAALREVRYAVSTDPDLPMLGGVLLDIQDDTFRVVATDRYRLAVSAVAGATVTGPSVAVIAPVALVDDALPALAAQGSVEVTLVIDGDTIALELDGQRLHGERLDYEFPDYRSLLRPSSGRPVPIDTATLRRDLTVAPLRTAAREQDGGDQSVAVLTLDETGGVSFQPGGPGGLEVGLNPEFLLQALNAGAAAQLVLELDGPITPLVIRDPRRPETLSLLMPVRLP